MKKIISIMLITLIMCFSSVLANTSYIQEALVDDDEIETFEALILNYYNLISCCEY